MRIDLRKNILDYEGRALPGQNGKPEVLRNIFATSLNTVVDGEVLTTEIKNRMYELTTKLYAHKEVDLTIDERKLIKDRVALLYGPLVFGRVSDILENDEREKPVPLDDEKPKAPENTPPKP